MSMAAPVAANCSRLQPASSVVARPLQGRAAGPPHPNPTTDLADEPLSGPSTKFMSPTVLSPGGTSSGERRVFNPATTAQAFAGRTTKYVAELAFHRVVAAVSPDDARPAEAAAT